MLLTNVSFHHLVRLEFTSFCGGDLNENFQGLRRQSANIHANIEFKTKEKINKNSENFLFLSNFISASMNNNFDSIALQFKWEKRVVNREIYWAIAWKCYRSIIINLNLNCKCIEIMMIIYENSELFQCTRNRSPKWDRIFNIVFRCLSRHITSRHVIPAS